MRKYLPSSALYAWLATQSRWVRVDVLAGILCAGGLDELVEHRPFGLLVHTLQTVSNEHVRGLSAR